MKESELRTRLKKLYPDVPADTHAAFMLTATSEREKPVMKQKLRFSPVLAILIVLMLTAVAYAVSTYSVRNMPEYQTNPEQLENHMVTIGQRFENDYMAVTVNDATFDGQSYAVAMNLESRNGEYVFVRPKLTAVSEGVAYYADVESVYNFDFMTAFTFPSLLHPEYNDGIAGFDGCLMGMDDFETAMPTGPVEWTLTLQVYRYVFEPVKDHFVFCGEEGEDERYAALCAEAYKNRQILVGEQENLMEYAAYVQPVTGIPEDEYFALDVGEGLAAAGALEKIDTIVCQWTTAFGDAPSKMGVTGTRIPCEGFDVVLDQFNVTYRQLNYHVRYAFEQDYTHDELEALAKTLPVHWLVAVNGSQDSVRVSSEGSGIDYLGDDDEGNPIWAICAGGEYMLDEEAATVSFLPYWGDWNRMDSFCHDDVFTVDVATGEITRGLPAGWKPQNPWDMSMAGLPTPKPLP